MKTFHQLYVLQAVVGIEPRVKVLQTHNRITNTTHLYNCFNRDFASKRGLASSCRTRICQRLKVSTFIYRHLQGNPGQQWFTIRSGVLTGNDTGGTAQVAAAHCPNEQTLDPTVCSQTDPPMPHYGLHPATFSGNDSLFLVASITRY